MEINGHPTIETLIELGKVALENWYLANGEGEAYEGYDKEDFKADLQSVVNNDDLSLFDYLNANWEGWNEDMFVFEEALAANFGWADKVPNE
jgi:hypothetical protein